MNQNFSDKPFIQQAFPYFERIANQLGGHLVQIQNDNNHRRFTAFLNQSTKEAEYLSRKLMEISIQKKSLLNEQISHFSELVIKLNSLQETITLPYMLYMIGVGNAGKSSVLNSLVGSNVAEVATLPKTWKTDLFFKAEKENNKSVKFLFRDNRPEQYYSTDEAKKVITQEEEKRENSEDLIDKEYRKLAKNFTTTEEKSGLKKELQDKLLYRSPIREVRWALTDLMDSTILDKFSLIDTPGLSQSNAGTHGEDGVRGEDIGDFYHQADGVLWILDATTLAASTPKLALEHLEKTLAKAHADHQGIHNIIAVLNFSDKIIQQGGQEALDNVLDTAKNIFGNKFIDIIPYSAKQAIQAIQNNDPILLESSGYNHLCDVTNKYFYYNAVSLRIQAKFQGFSGEISTYQSNFFQPYLERLNEDHQKLKNRISKANKDLENLKQQLQNEWKVKFSEYRKIVEKNIDSHASQLVEMPSHQHASYMENHIFRLDLLKGYQSQYYNNSVKKLSDTMEKYRKYDTEHFTKYKYIKNHQLLDINTENMQNNTTEITQLNLSELDMGGLFIGGGAALIGMALLGPIGIAAGLIGFLFGKSKAEKAKDSMRENLNNLENNCLTNNQSFINRLFEKAIPTLQQDAENAFAILHLESDKVQQITDIFESLDNIKNTEFQKESFAHLLFS